MKKQLNHFSVWQTSKIIALVYLIGSAIFLIPLAIIFTISTSSAETLWWLIIPFFYWLLSLVGMAFFCWIYNISAKWVGGIEFTTTDSQSNCQSCESIHNAEKSSNENE